MTLLSLVALIGCLFAIAMGFTVVLGERGYHFDLRRRDRRRRSGRVGGRREGDVPARA